MEEHIHALEHQKPLDLLGLPEIPISCLGICRSLASVWGTPPYGTVTIRAFVK